MGLAKNAKGTVLLQSAVVSAILLVVCVGLLGLTRYEHSRQYNRIHWSEAYYAAEVALLEGVQKIADVPATQTVQSIYGTYTASSLPNTPDGDVKEVTFTIGPDPQNVPTYHLVTATANVNGKRRTLQARVQYRPPSQVFNHEYFLNNWGWWWGSSITGNGDNRSNWDFDFKDKPTVNGHIYAAAQIESNLVPVNPFASPPFKGWAGSDPLTYCHVGTERVKMPNLKDLTYYIQKANGTIKQGNTVIVNKTFGFSGTKTGVYLKGTSTNPIQISGTVVVNGDVILDGVITGTGTVYAGGNIYIAGNLDYKNGPTWSLPPNHASMTPAQRQAWYDSWVDQQFAAGKDLIGFAARGHILFGQVNSSTWNTRVMTPSNYGLANLGREDQLGRDGIRGTADDGIPYLDTNNDGRPDSAAYDADEDGVIRTTNYSWSNDFQMTSSRASKIQGYPTSNNQPVDFNTISSSAITKITGIFYTNHAFGGYTSQGPVNMYGALICRDEAVIFSNSLTFWYDYRIHGRYVHKYFDSDGNKIVDLELPIAYKTKIVDRKEVVSAN
ncbi:MAG: hypothetical protein N2644_03480 [Candidatus Sumerlaea chitinivorans]|uniref:Uncharacterized protein n=1 Tax=Sumerlaea chitinivorans TaxID=2250252 RepID=A0A2Z4Y8C6_SUMC1|nr:hypothetical protein BRCON_2291 [Candidatus Sumerlaea chitinivorans]MCX7963533.1 hypothetical protein [Candidatus Sumerlaea chitinivorans]